MKSKPAFTLIELLVVIAIIGLLTTIAVISLNNARAKARDAKRVADVKQVQTALELFFNDEGRYPTETELNSGSIYATSTSGTTTYMKIIPAASNPPDGSCTTNQNNFIYSPTPDGSSYTINYCVGGVTGSLSTGSQCATPGGISTGGGCGVSGGGAGNVILGCVASNWSPDPASECQGTFTQTSNCNDTRLAVGTRVDSIWTPDTNSVCSGESFTQTGDCGSSQNSTGTLTCSNGHTCISGSCQINQYTLTYTASAYGSLTGITPQTVNYGNNGSAITAIADSGYRFVDWSDSSTSNPRTDTNISGNLSVTANFSPICSSASVSYGGESYPTVAIGNQCWLAKNLNIGTRVAGSQNQGNYSGGIQKYCFNNLDASCTTDGGLYQWHMAMGLDQVCDTQDTGSCALPTGNIQGICPTGWHVSSDSSLPDNNSDWRILEQGLATNHSCDTTQNWGCAPAGDKLKKALNNPFAGNNGCSVPGDPNCGTSGFEGLLAGMRYSNGSFYSRGGNANLWTAQPYAGDPSSAWYRQLSSGDAGVARNGFSRIIGFSVRCVQD